MANLANVASRPPPQCTTPKKPRLLCRVIDELLSYARELSGTRRTTMPLPHIKRLCSATCRRTGQPCQNPAAYGQKTCRFHGAHKTVASGRAHGMYKTGEYTKESKQRDRESAKRLLELEAMAFGASLVNGNRTRGRRPK